MSWTFQDFPMAERVVIRYLTDAGIANVSTQLPDDPQWPSVTITRVGGNTTPGLGADMASIQIDVWGDGDDPEGQAHAAELMAHIRTLLWEMPGADQIQGATVTDVAPTTGLLWLPDQTVTPERPRYTAGVLITLY